LRLHLAGVWFAGEPRILEILSLQVSQEPEELTVADLASIADQVS
jgi:hypothetical protein